MTAPMVGACARKGRARLTASVLSRCRVLQETLSYSCTATRSAQRSTRRRRHGHLTTQADGDTVSYTLRIPAGYEGHTALPVILCLHFGGQPTEWYGGRFLHLMPLPGLGSRVALLVAPTAAQSGWATPTGAAAACAALAAVAQHLRVDTQRRVVMGYSMGGRGAWHLAATFHAHFVAAIPIAGTPGEIALDTLRDLPLSVIHSEADRRVPIEDTAKAVEQLHAMRAPVAFARLPSGDHFEARG